VAAACLKLLLRRLPGGTGKFNGNVPPSMLLNPVSPNYDTQMITNQS